MPEPFTAQWILSNQLFTQATLDEIGDNSPANGGNDPFNAVICLDAQNAADARTI
jgi:hypothetical protein